MNTAQEIISYAATHDINLVIRNDKLVIDAPKESLTDEFLDTAKEHKPEIIKALTERWNPELCAKGYQWCFDCKNWDGQSCTSKDNPYAEVEKCPQAARICKWYEGKT